MGSLRIFWGYPLHYTDVSVEFRYDANGRRLRKTVVASAETVSSTDYIYSGMQCLEERNAVTDAMTKQYVWGLYVDELLQIKLADGTKYYSLQDMLYRTSVLTDSNQDITESYEYTPYGQTIIYDSTGTVKTTNPICEYLFTGRQLDNETGLYYYRARYYSPTLGRFISKDPIGYVDSMGLYEYVKSMPEISLDAFGLWKIERKNQATAIARTNTYHDTLKELAEIVGLGFDEWQQWLQPETPNDPNSYSLRPLGDDILACGQFKVPNIILAVWAGWEGLGRDFAQFYVMWGKDKNDLRNKGYMIKELTNPKESAIRSAASQLTTNRTLEGLLFWGHGGGNVLITQENQASSGDPDYYLWLTRLRRALAYKLGFGMIYACHGDESLPYIMSHNARAWGAHGILVPLGFHLNAPTVGRLLSQGRQPD